MTALRDEDVERALVVVAHPDDAEFWAGGTVAHWVAAGVQVSYCVLTDGDAGGFDPGVPRAAVPGMRRAEQQAAADILGVTSVEFLGHAEDGLGADERLRKDLVRIVRQLRPQRVLTWSPQWNWLRFRSSHPNHRATGEVTLAAVYPDAGNRFAHMDLLGQGLEPWTVAEIWLLNSPAPDHFVDITETFECKVAAVRAHASQVANRPGLARDLRARIEPNTAAAGLPEGRLAEAFQVVLNR